MRVVILQYGNYGDAYRRLQDGGSETFRDQRHHVEFIASLAAEHEVTTVAICDRPHDEILAPGLRSVGVPFDLVWDPNRIGPLLGQFGAEAFLCRTPNRFALAWAAQAAVPTLPCFADNFANSGLKPRLNNWRLSRVLARCVTPCISNHSLSASHSLTGLGFSPTKIVPWEHARLKPVGDAKEAPRRDRPFRLFFAGALTEEKGVGDCIQAVAIAKAKNLTLELNMAGSGDTEKWTAFARELGVESSVRMLGVIAAERVLAEMRYNDAVIVPSRHEYSEGLPNTVFEALASRSPLIASDHPAYVNRLRPTIDSLRFHAGHAPALAEQVERLAYGSELYARLSRQSASALSNLYIGIEWTELVRRFIADPLCKTRWADGITLADYMNLSRQQSAMEERSARGWFRFPRVLQNLQGTGTLATATS